MKRLITLLVTAVLIALVSVGNSAEILLTAKKSWMITADTLNFSIENLIKMRRQEGIGAPIVVKPDGWVWGKKERPPAFIVLKIPGASVAQVNKYLVPLHDTIFDTIVPAPLEVDTIPYIKKLRKWWFPRAFIDSARILYQNQEPIVLTIAQAKALIRRFNIAGDTTIGDN